MSQYKVQIAEDRIIDLEKIYDIGREQAVNAVGEKIDGKFVTTFRVVGIDRYYIMGGEKGDTLWNIAKSLATPVPRPSPERAG